jgi:hypothetical protein
MHRNRIDMFSTVQRGQPLAEFLVEGSNLGAARLIVFFEKPEGFSHDFTG